MRQIFVFTAGDRNARSHLNDSILNAIPFQWIEESVGTEAATYFRPLTADGTAAYAWGAVPGPVNQRTWSAMHVGDLVLTVYANQYQFLSSVVGKIHSLELANRIWGQDELGRTWEYMYLLTPPQPIAVHVLSEPVASLLNKGYRGFTRISGEKVANIRQMYGSLENFVQSVLQAAVPPTHIEREITRAEEELTQTYRFDPTDMTDGRRRVIQEVVRRQGQPEFRNRLLSAYGETCAVTGCNVPAVLQAAHISPYLGPHSNSVQNGLLLRADIHTLFDIGLLKITVEGRIEVDSGLAGSIYEQYHGRCIRYPDCPHDAPSTDALRFKYELVL